MIRTSPLFFSTVFAVSILLAGCAAQTTPPATPVEAPAAFAGPVPEPATAPTPDRWWTVFGDPTLDRLVEEALRSNLDLEAAWQRLRQARAIAERAGSDRFPDLDATTDATRRRSDRDDDDSGDFGDQGDEDELRLGLEASYEVDLWGRIDASIDAERFRAEASRADYRSIALLLSAEVARTYFQILEARDQLDLLDEQIGANEKVEKLLENRFAGGQVRGVDVLRQRQLVEATREQRVIVVSRLGVLENLLAVLVGQPPSADSPLGEGNAAASNLPTLPPFPATGVPAELVRRRPDVEAAFLRLEAADRDLAAAIANRYPRLTLGASLATTESDSTDLFDDWIRTLAGGLLAPLFRGGELDAEVDRAEAARAERVAAWGQATLSAFREVENALVLEAAARDRLASLETQLRFAERAREQLRYEYLNGSGDYIEVLLAVTEAQSLDRDRVAARLDLLDARLALYRALAGGFETTPDTR